MSGSLLHSKKLIIICLHEVVSVILSSINMGKFQQLFYRFLKRFHREKSWLTYLFSSHLENRFMPESILFQSPVHHSRSTPEFGVFFPFTSLPARRGQRIRAGWSAPESLFWSGEPGTRRGWSWAQVGVASIARAQLNRISHQLTCLWFFSFRGLHRIRILKFLW